MYFIGALPQTHQGQGQALCALQLPEVILCCWLSLMNPHQLQA